MKQLDKRQVIGWIAVAISTIITCFWAFWGIIENFHEGWYYEISGIEPVLRVSQRIDDGDHGARLVHGNELDLVWAPDGPGWPRTGANWHEAQGVIVYGSRR